MQKAFILSENEYAQMQSCIEQLESDNTYAHNRIKYLSGRVADLKAVVTSNNKALAAKAHELRVKEAELASLSSKLREMERDMKGTEDALKLARIEIACWESGGL